MAYGFTKELLVSLHIDKNLTTMDISKLYNCDRSTVLLALKRFGISPRGKIKKPMPEDQRKELYDMYVVQKLSTRQIAKLKGVSHGHVSDMLKKAGIPVEDRLASLASERNPNWKNGKTIAQGYIEYSSAQKYGKHQREHRAIMERYIGRPLKSNEIVHHIDGDKTNNNINNLALMDITAHTRLHSLERWHKK